MKMMKFNLSSVILLNILFFQLISIFVYSFRINSINFESTSTNHQEWKKHARDSMLNHKKNSLLPPMLLSRSGRKKLVLQDALLNNVEGFSQAFVGGTIGVLSVAVIVEIRRLLNRGFEDCPYCLGNGEMLCAACCGGGSLVVSSVEGGSNSNENNKFCEVCGGRGMVMCLNCKGDGRITPIILQSRATRDPEYATDGISIDSP